MTLVQRVFRAKLEELKHQLFKREIFGKVLAYVYKLYATESFDQIVSTELPDKDKNLHLYTDVIKHMMHRPCEILNPTNVSRKKNGHCKNSYPRHFVPSTTIGNDFFPYNPYLLAMFDCHINIEICSTIKTVKYLYKYVYKGHDRVAFTLVSEQLNGLLHQKQLHPAVYSLHLHLENQHHVTFRAHENLNNVISSDLSVKSMLTEFFSTNQKQVVIGRIVTANPFEVNGVLAPTFREAATMQGLLERDDSVEECLQEASLYQMPCNLRQLFATILVYCNPANPRYLWEHFEQDMSPDFQLIEHSQSNVRMQVLRSISMTLESMGRDINSFQLLDRNIHFDEDEFLSKEIDDELAVLIPEEDILASTLLNREQQIVYNLVSENVFSNQNAAFFIDGPDGTGKTFLYKALLATIRSRHLIALATASFGVVALILPGGRTTHSRFKINLDNNKNFICSVSKQSGLAKLLQVTKLIIWDETSMSRKEAIEALDRMLKDVNDSELSFGGKVIIFGGDFHQILPVVLKGTRQQQIDVSLVSSYLWPTLTKIRLTENMRARLDPDFSNYILELGNEMPPITIDEYAKIPTTMLIPYQNDTAFLDHFLDAGFNDISEYSVNISNMMNRAILTPKDSYRFSGEIKQYYSFDETIDASEQAIMEDFLNTLTPNGFPPHQLLLKQNCPIILFRNINPSEGLCNGTRLICCNFDHNVIHAEIVIGHQSGKKVFISKIPFLPKPNENSSFPFKRTQFLIRLNFTMSINKSEGQTAKTISAFKILIRPISIEESENNSTKNIIYTELLTIAASD
ncbi:hypothetical protein I3843_11G152200 [Carya illinoinensis]|nr:hypothetical protein I3843_11G152200 [Carya illinoinensis]